MTEILLFETLGLNLINQSINQSNHALISAFRSGRANWKGLQQ